MRGWDYELKIFNFEFCPTPITGGIEQGESPAQACRREIFEETGLQFALSDLFPVGQSTVKIDEDLTIQKSLFLVRTEQKEIRLSDEHVDFQWLPLDQIASQLYWPSNQATFETIREVLSLIAPPYFF